MKSMTGFAKRQETIEGRTTIVEIKTLNSKQLDATVKITPRYRHKELEIRTMLNKLERGKIDFQMTEERETATENVLNSQYIAERYAEIKALSEKLDVNVDGATALEIVMRQPDCWESNEESEVDENAWLKVKEMIEESIEELEKTRFHEGEILKKDIAKHVDAIEELSKQIPSFEDERIQAAKERIKTWLAESGVTVDENRFEQELIYYLEKWDITEEKVRLAKHINYFREVMEEGICGKKLGFIAQEMGREINTTGSKANHVEIQRRVVCMKDELEKIKEQLGNIL